jgi:hypothetical protein
MSKERTDHIDTTEESLSPQPGLPSSRSRPAPQTLWRESPTSLTRDRAPSHRIPKADRFCSTKLDLLKLHQLDNLQVEPNVKGKTGVSFPRSTRPEHFAKPELASNPSPTDYYFAPGKQEINHKAKSERSLSR